MTMPTPADQPGLAATVYESDIPGLYDVQMPDGSWRGDITVGQLRSMVFDGMPILPPVLRSK